MAARTFTSAGVNNLWSNVANWDGGATIPQEDDSVTIPAGQTCEYDYNSAYTTGIAGITINGTLKLTRTAGTYKLFMKAATTITGAGTFDCGASALDPIPFAAKHTITGGANWYVDGTSGLTMTVYGTEPTNKYVKLSAQEANGQTVLSVDTDVRSDIWAAGDTITIVGGTNNIGNYGASDHTIDIGGIAETEITVTPAIAAVRVAGSYIVLTQRNVTILMGAGTTNNYCIYKMGEGKFTMGSALLSTGAVSKPFFNSNSESNYITITGGVCYVSALTYNTISSTISNFIAVCSSRFLSNYSKNNVIDNCLILKASDSAAVESGNIFKNCTFAFMSNCTTSGWNSFENCIIKNTAFGASNALYQMAGIRFTNCTFQYNNYDSYTSHVLFYNCEFLNSSNGIRYTSSGASNFGFAESFDHEKSAGAYKRWTLGGTIASQVSVLPTGYTLAYIHPLVSATYYSHFPVRFMVPAGESVSVEVQLRKSESMTYLPRVYLMNSIEHPLVDATQALDSFTMTDSTDTWESDTFTIDNSAVTIDKNYTLWFIGKNASGNMYSAYDITTQGGAGGSVKILPYSGKVGLV